MKVTKVLVLNQKSKETGAAFAVPSFSITCAQYNTQYNCTCHLLQFLSLEVHPAILLGLEITAEQLLQ